MIVALVTYRIGFHVLGQACFRGTLLSAFSHRGCRRKGAKWQLNRKMNRGIREEVLCSQPIEFRISSPSRRRIYAWHRPNASPVLIRNWIAHLFLAVKSTGNFAQPRKRSGLFPARFERPREDLLKMIAVVDGGMKKNNVGAFFRVGYLHLHFLGKCT